MADNKNKDNRETKAFNWRDYDALHQRFTAAVKDWKNQSLAAPLPPSLGACALMGRFLLTSQIEEIWERWLKGQLIVSSVFDPKTDSRQIFLTTAPKIWGSPRSVEIQLDLVDISKTRAFVDGSPDPSPFVIDAINLALWS